MRRAMGAIVLFAVACAGCAGAGSRLFEPEVAEGELSAVIYVYRPRGGGSTPLRVFLDQRDLGLIRSGTYMPVPVAPGTHLVRVESRSEVVREVRLIQQDSVFLEASTSGWSGTAQLEAPDSGLAAQRIRGLRRSR